MGSKVPEELTEAQFNMMAVASTREKRPRQRVKCPRCGMTIPRNKTKVVKDNEGKLISVCPDCVGHKLPENKDVFT